LWARGRPRAHKVVVIVGLVLLVALTAKFAAFSWVA